MNSRRPKAANNAWAGAEAENLVCLRVGPLSLAAETANGVRSSRESILAGSNIAAQPFTVWQWCARRTGEAALRVLTALGPLERPRKLPDLIVAVAPELLDFTWLTAADWVEPAVPLLPLRWKPPRYRMPLPIFQLPELPADQQAQLARELFLEQ